jgi:hypothetical protein
MLALGVLLVAIAAVALLAALVGGSNEAADFDLGLFTWDTTTMGVFLLGCATVLVFVMGLELIRSGARRAHARRKEHKELTRLSQRLQEREQQRRTSDPADDPASN